jgi:hypothetical protein
VKSVRSGGRRQARRWARSTERRPSEACGVVRAQQAGAQQTGVQHDHATQTQPRRRQRRSPGAETGRSEAEGGRSAGCGYDVSEGLVRGAGVSGSRVSGSTSAAAESAPFVSASTRVV